MPKQVVGRVYWIANGKQTSRVVDVQEAFTDPDQARSQIQFADASGDKEQIRLVRLAFRQFQGMRYRGENRAKVPKKGRSKSKRPTSAKNVGIGTAKSKRK